MRLFQLIAVLIFCPILGLVLNCGDAPIQAERLDKHMSRGEYGGGAGETLGANQSLVKKSWSTSGRMLSGDTNQKVSLQQQFGQAGTYTVQFSLIPDGDPTGTFSPIQTEGLITFFVDGNSVQRRVSIGGGGGTSVSGVCDGIQVEAIDKSVAVSGNLGEGYRVAITVSPGGRGTDSNPPVLITQNDANSGKELNLIAAAGNTVTIPIPQNCGVKSVQVNVSSSAPIQDQEVRVDQFTRINAQTSYDPRSVYFAPVWPGAISLKVVNVLGAKSIRVSVAFGIDG